MRRLLLSNVGAESIAFNRWYILLRSLNRWWGRLFGGIARGICWRFFYLSLFKQPLVQVWIGIRLTPCVMSSVLIDGQQDLAIAGNRKVLLTIYENAGHDAWSQTYANPDLYEWLFEQRQIKEAPTDPTSNATKQPPPPTIERTKQNVPPIESN